MALLNQKAVKTLAREHNRRVGKDFIAALECHIERKVVAACREHNGGKVTIDASLATHVGLRK